MGSFRKLLVAALVFVLVNPSTPAMGANVCRPASANQFRLVDEPSQMAGGGVAQSGDTALAERRYEDAEAIFKDEFARASTPAGKLSAQARLGLAQLLLGDARSALKSLNGSVALAKELGDTGAAARGLYNLGLLALSVADAGDGEDPFPGLFPRPAAMASSGYFSDAALQAQPAHDPALGFKSRVGQIRALVVAGDLSGASRQLALIQANVQTFDDRLIVADAARRIIEAAAGEDIAAKVASEARQQLKLALQSAGTDRDRSLAHGFDAALQMSLGHTSDAMVSARRALAFGERVEAEDLRFRWLALIAEAHRREGDRAAARLAFEAARNSVERVRASLPQFDPVTGRSLFREVVGPMFTQLAALYVEGLSATNSSKALETSQVSLMRARSTIEVLKQVEAEQFFRDECVAAALGQSFSIEDVLKTEGGTLAVYPVIVPGAERSDPDRLILLTTREGHISAVQSIIPRGQLRATILKFRTALIENARDQRPIVDQGARLYDWLIRPLTDQLGGVDTLVFIPDGPLRLLPWSALYDREIHSYLVERFAVANSVGLDLTAPKALSATRPRVLLAGLSNSVSIPSDDAVYDKLPAVDTEMASVEAHFPGAVERLSGDLTEKSLSAALSRERFSIVHLATHATFRPSLRDTYLVGAEGKITFDSLQKLIKSTQTNGQPIELLSLSACETATGNDRAALGLAGAAIKAGARSIVASLWPITDYAAPQFFDRFYGGLSHDNLSKAKAVQQAQLQLLRQQDDPLLSHPHFWAPFVVIGNWQ